ncbi:hypothetical protein OIU78_005131 [Salix suchowensis]|nr:hypothetical protein OIU78_005131 [Salix suchowensis]
MVEEGIEPTPELYTALLAAYCRNNLIDEGFLIINQMKSLPRCQPDVYTYSILLKSCVDASRFELIETLYQEMDERLISPNTVTQNVVLSGYGKVGMYDQMERVLSGMLESEACKPDVWTMNIILSVFGNKGQIDLMERWYEKFRNFGIEPETRTFNILIGAYGKKRMYDKMSSVMEYMRKVQFPWTTSTYNNVIEAFADAGDAKNMEYAFDQMRAESMKADTKTFCCLINGYANAGLFHKVISSVQLAAKFEIPENTSFYNAVISACAMADDLMEMERVFKRMKDKQCPPDSRTYSIMVEAYRKEGMNDKIYYLEQEQQEMIGNGTLKRIAFITPWAATSSCKLLLQCSSGRMDCIWKCSQKAHWLCAYVTAAHWAGTLFVSGKNRGVCQSVKFETKNKDKQHKDVSGIVKPGRGCRDGLCEGGDEVKGGEGILASSFHSFLLLLSMNLTAKESAVEQGSAFENRAEFPPANLPQRNRNLSSMTSGSSSLTH